MEGFIVEQKCTVDVSGSYVHASENLGGHKPSLKLTTNPGSKLCLMVTDYWWERAQKD